MTAMDQLLAERRTKHPGLLESVVEGRHADTASIYLRLGLKLMAWKRGDSHALAEKCFAKSLEYIEKAQEEARS